MNDSGVLTTVPSPQAPLVFFRCNLEQKRIALEVVTISYSKALTYHHALEFCFPEGPYPPLDVELEREISMACGLPLEDRLELINQLALDCCREEMETR